MEQSRSNLQSEFPPNTTVPHSPSNGYSQSEFVDSGTLSHAATAAMSDIQSHVTTRIPNPYGLSTYDYFTDWPPVEHGKCAIIGQQLGI